MDIETFNGILKGVWTAVGKWTTSVPTEPGWYWAIDCGEILIVRVLDYGHGDIWAEGGINHRVWPLEHFTRWLGPLPKPELPDAN